MNKPKPEQYYKLLSYLDNVFNIDCSLLSNNQLYSNVENINIFFIKKISILSNLKSFCDEMLEDFLLKKEYDVSDYLEIIEIDLKFNSLSNESNCIEEIKNIENKIKTIKDIIVRVKPKNQIF